MGTRLQGKRTILTGAASGIGRASAVRFAAEGAKLVLVDVQPEALAETAKLAQEAGGTDVVTYAGDVGDEAQVAAFVELCRSSFGGVDVLFANAGISGGMHMLADLGPDLFHEVLRVNLLGPYMAVRAVVPWMREAGGGSIICTASVAGIRANAGGIAYSASKAGVISLVQTMAAQELNHSNIRINAICPGLIETGMTKPVFEYARATGRHERLGQYSPMGRYGVPDEIASAALFLASDESSYVHGQALAVDGGLTSTLPHRISRPTGDNGPPAPPLPSLK